MYKIIDDTYTPLTTFNDNGSCSSAVTTINSMDNSENELIKGLRKRIEEVNSHLYALEELLNLRVKELNEHVASLEDIVFEVSEKVDITEEVVSTIYELCISDCEDYEENCCSSSQSTNDIFNEDFDPLPF